MFNIVASYGRFHPFTRSHEEMFLAMERYEPLDGGIKLQVVGTSASYDAKQNWLSFQTKEHLFQHMFKDFNRPLFVQTRDLNNFFKYLDNMSSEYDNLYYFCGPDRVEKATLLLNKYNGKEFVFNSVTVVPFISSDATIRATRLRQSILDNDKDTFKKLLPKCYSKGYALLTWNMIRASLEKDHHISLSSGKTC